MENKKTTEFDRMQFLEMVVSSFINKTTYSSLKTAYDGLVQLVSRNSDSVQREEKRKILEKCFGVFCEAGFKKKIAEIRTELNPKPNIFTRATTKFISERVLGDQKRKYDMSNRYSENQITSGSTLFIPVNGLSVSVTDMFGQRVDIQKVGTLKYGTQSVDSESIDKYKIRRTLSDSSIQEFEIFSFIDLNMLEENPEYRDVVLGELLSQNNIELSNTNGYVGEIVSTKTSSIQLHVGEQRENDEKFYRYQASPKYALIYDPQDLSAVVYHSRQAGISTQTNKKIESSKDDTDRS